MSVCRNGDSLGERIGPVVSTTYSYQQQTFKTMTDKKQPADGEPDVSEALGMLEYYCEQAHAKEPLMRKRRWPS